MLLTLRVSRRQDLNDGRVFRVEPAVRFVETPARGEHAGLDAARRPDLGRAGASAGPRGVLATRPRSGRADLGQALRPDAGLARARDAVEAVPRPVDRIVVEGARAGHGHRAVREAHGSVTRPVPRRPGPGQEAHGPAGRAVAAGLEPSVAQPA